MHRSCVLPCGTVSIEATKAPDGYLLESSCFQSAGKRGIRGAKFDVINDNENVVVVGRRIVMKRISCVLLLLFFMVNITYIDVFAAGGTFSPEQEQNEQKMIREGESKKKSEIYFSMLGKKKTGWCKIKNKYYYFNEKGVLQKNKIVGNKKSGYYYVDLDGIRVTDKNIQYAVKFVMKNSSSKDSSKKRLKSCYKALCKYRYRRFYSEKPSAKKIKLYAGYMFKNKRGNCYRYASAFAYIARVLGYDSCVSVGGVTAYANSGLSPHGWCEVKINGKWTICDCSMQRAHKKNNLFLCTKKKYPFKIRCSNTYTMYVKKGKVSWK